MSTATLLTIPQKLDLLESDVNMVAFERTVEIETGVTGMVARASHAQIGPPGVGKTWMVEQMHKRIEMGTFGYFPWFLTRYSVPEEVFGPYSPAALKNLDQFKRNTTGKLPEAKLAFLDEMFKANSALLNSLLKIMNEGVFFNGIEEIHCKPIIFAGSNEIPKDAELAALWDRVIFRLFVKPLQNRDNRLKLLRMIAMRSATANIETVITWAEIEEAQRLAALVTLPGDVFSALGDLWEKLNREGIEASDRRFGEIIKIVQATAYRAGRSEADIEDARLVRHALWINPNDIPVVTRCVLEMSSPLDNAAVKLIEDVDKLNTKVEELLRSSESPAMKRRKGVELHTKMAKLGKDLDALQAKAKASTKRYAMITEARSRLKVLVKSVLELYGVEGKQP
jgi:MoxR-like ATPase